MKKPKWLEKEKLYSIMFESDVPMGRVFDLVLIVAISLSIIISFIETIPELARTFKLALEVLEYLLTFFFTVEYIARVYCSPRPKEYVLHHATLPLLFLPQRTIHDPAAFVPVHTHLPHLQAVQLHQRRAPSAAIAQEEFHKDYRLFPVRADLGHLPGHIDVHD